LPRSAFPKRACAPLARVSRSMALYTVITMLPILAL
jgi:hypothetical protein